MPQNLICIKVSDYTKYPGPRFKRQGENSGEEFRDKILELIRNKIESSDLKIIIDLDGVSAYSTAFLDESIVQLPKYSSGKLTNDRLRQVLSIKTTRFEFWKRWVDMQISSKNIHS